MPLSIGLYVVASVLQLYKDTEYKAVRKDSIKYLLEKPGIQIKG